MATKFDPRHSHKLDSPERKKMLPPEKTLRELGLNTGDILIDIGCGTGYFSIPAKEIVGKEGRVIAADVSGKMLEEAKRKAKEKNTELEFVKCREYEIPIGDEIGTFILMSNVLHEVEDKVRFLREAWRVLKIGGRAGIVEWQKKKTKNGPPLAERMDEREVQRVLEELGFRFLTSFPAGEWFRVYSAVKE